MKLSRSLPLGIAAGVLGLSTAAHAVIFYSTADPNHNTSAPTGALANSGWQWQGNWAGAFTGTPIAPQYFIAAKHTGGSLGGTFTLGGKNYTTIQFPDGASFKDIPNSDLRIWRVGTTFPSYATLYNDATDGTEVNKNIVVIGRGTQRGAEVRLPQTTGVLKGWLWGTNDQVRRWGENKIAAIHDYASVGDSRILRFDFDASGSGNVGPNKAQLSAGDSGGGAFIKVGDAWKLAGLGLAVSGPYSYTADGPTFNAALFDTGGFYDRSGPTPVFIIDTPFDKPAASYLSRISPVRSTILGLMTGPPVWDVDAAGNWSASANWWGGIPSGAGVEAIFGNVITTDRSVNIDSPRTVGTITFDNPNRYTLAGSTLTIDVSSGNGNLQVLNGNHTISAPLNLAKNTTVTVNSTLTVSGALTATGIGLTKSGAGTLEVRNVRAASLAVNQGTVRVTPDGNSSGLSRLDSLSIAAGARLDLTDNDLLIDYSGPSPFTTIQQYVIDGYRFAPDPGATGIVSTTSQNQGGDTILVLVDNAAVGGMFTSWLGQPVDFDTIIGKYTYFGDVNLDGQVTGDDFALVVSNLGMTSGAQWVFGDMNFDQQVTGDDITLVIANLGKGVGNPLGDAARLSGSVVPEPGAGLLLLAGAFILAPRRRRYA